MQLSGQQIFKDRVLNEEVVVQLVRGKQTGGQNSDLGLVIESIASPHSTLHLPILLQQESNLEQGSQFFELFVI